MMKRNSKNIENYLFMLVILASMFSCKGMYENIEPYSEEVVYPAKYDTIISKIGFERVELDLMKVGRIPSKQIKMGKSSKTIIEYDDQQIVIDSLVSWVNVKNLTMPKLYRIKVYTIDEFQNKSVPQVIAVIPFTKGDVENLVVSSPRIMTSPNAAVLDWTTSLSSILLDYRSLSYEYTDRNGTKVSGIGGNNPRIFAGNLSTGEPFDIQMTYNVVPKVGGQPILDSVKLVSPLTINMPTGSTPFNPAERDILTANGVTEFTADGVASIKKLTFPVHAGTLQDLFYFGSVEEVDLTGGDLFDLTTLAYDRNNIKMTIGGGDYLPFISKVSPISDANAQALIDLLEAGIVKKVKYAPNSMGIDHLLRPFDEQGLIEWTSVPNESFIPMNFFLDGKVQDANGWALDIVNPATSFPAGTNIVNPIKITMKGKNGTFVFTLPTQYRFNMAEYKYLKFNVYAPAKSTFAGAYAPFQRLWPRLMNYLWAFKTESSFGQELWNADPNDFKIPDDKLEKWHEVTVDLTAIENRHTRVFALNIGGEPSMTWAPAADMVYYFSNFRFSK